MDPVGGQEDAKLWEVLSAVRLKDAVQQLGGLDAQMVSLVET